MLSNNKKTKFTLFFLQILIIFILIIITGCSSDNNGVPENYGDILKAAVYIDPESVQNDGETAATTNIISGTIPLNPTESTTIAETTTIDESAEITGTEESTEPTESIGHTEPDLSTEVSEPYVITPSGKKYHYPTCRHAKNIKQYISKEEAERLGYGPCGTCKPE